jgi:hypothetical protein
MRTPRRHTEKGVGSQQRLDKIAIALGIIIKKHGTNTYR